MSDSMNLRQFDLVRDVLDHAVVDVDGVPCGMVDDVELDCEPGRPLEIVALLMGPGSWQRRLPRWAALVARKMIGMRTVKVPWARVVKIGEKIELDAKAAELNLDAADRRLAKWFASVPMS